MTTDVGAPLREILEEVDSLRIANAELKARCERHLTNCEKLMEARDALREKLDAIDTKGLVLDGDDEAWLIRHQAELRFKRRREKAEAVVTVRAHGRVICQIMGPEVGDSLIRRAVTAARIKRG